MAGDSEVQDPLEVLTQAEGKREAGNGKFRAGDVKAAYSDYQETLKILGKAFFEGAELEERAKACRVPTALNLALCCLRAEPVQAQRALELCEEVLDCDPDNAKAHYRKGKALLVMEEYEEAEYELKEACKLAPGDTAVREDLEKLRRKLKGFKAKEKEMSQNILKGAGFASDGREAYEKQAAAVAAAVSTDYDFLRDPAENPYTGSDSAHEEAQRLVASGKLEEAVWAWEAAMSAASAKNDWAAHFGHRLELGKLFMDLNVDALALRLLNGAAGIGLKSDAEVQPTDAVRRHALLLRAVCLLNEAEADAKLEVGSAVEVWLEAEAPHEVVDSGEVDERVARHLANSGPSADASVALGLLHLVCGRDASQAFADALVAPADEGSCFSSAKYTATKWNMLGAVLANQKKHGDALAAYEQALKLQPHYPRALVNYGIALQMQKEPLKACEAYTYSVEISPLWAAPVLWPKLHKAADETGNQELVEAAANRNVSRARELLGPRPEEPSLPQAPAAEVLAKIGLKASA